MRKAGIIILIIGILMLISAIVLTTTIGTIAVPILLSGSILVNSTGIVLIRQSRR